MLATLPTRTPRSSTAEPTDSPLTSPVHIGLEQACLHEVAPRTEHKKARDEKGNANEGKKTNFKIVDFRAHKRLTELHGWPGSGSRLKKRRTHGSTAPSRSSAGFPSAIIPLALEPSMTTRSAME